MAASITASPAEDSAPAAAASGGSRTGGAGGGVVASIGAGGGVVASIGAEDAASTKGVDAAQAGIVSDGLDASAGHCWFEFLGFWGRCEESWSPPRQMTRVAGPLSECGQRCLTEENCASVVDYDWLDPSIGCWLNESGHCTVAVDGVSFAEDAGREYRKVCTGTPPADAIFTFDDSLGIVVDPASGCRFESIGDDKSCENSVPFAEATVTGKTFTDCLLACENRPDCSAVEDAFSNSTGYECALHLSTCDAPAASMGFYRFYRKVCGSDR